jgi:plasmid maintenance system killer protein
LPRCARARRNCGRSAGRCGAKKIQQRLKDLRGAETLADMRYLPGRCHELRENLAGLLSLDLDHPYRLLFRPTENTGPGPGGGLDWSEVTAVTVVSVTDTHS